MTDSRDSEVVRVAHSTSDAKRSDVKLDHLRAKNFNDLLLQSIDETLADLLGRKAREAIYDYLARERSMSKSDIPTRLNDLSSLLESIFGKGSKTVERSIVRKLYKVLGWDFADIPSYGLQDYLTMAKQRLERERPSWDWIIYHSQTSSGT